MGSKANRPVGITAVSTLLVTMGALVSGVAILVLCQDIQALTTAAGLRFEAVMLGFIFTGFSFGGFGIGLYEGYPWARPAALAALAFVATLQVFSLATTGMMTIAISYQVELLALVAVSVIYLSLQKSKRFFRPIQQTQSTTVDHQAEAIGALQQVS
jgi:hypothetical protein